jgi:recombination protein RecT
MSNISTLENQQEHLESNNYYLGDIMNLPTTQQNKQLAPFDKVKGLLDKMVPQIARALPKHLTPDRMTRIALTELRKVPKLLQCTPESFCGAIMACSQLGLEPGSALGQIYLIPFGKDVQVILGYKGMIELARRSGQIVSLAAHEVYEKDLFEFEYGLDEKLRHVPNLSDRGALIAVYAVAKFVGGGHQIEVMSKQDVDKIRTRSKSGNSSPWVSDYSEMAKKTAVRKLFKYLPISIEKLQMATALDEQADLGTQNMHEILSSDEDLVINYDTGEVIDAEVITQQADSLADKIK